MASSAERRRSPARPPARPGGVRRLPVVLLVALGAVGCAVGDGEGALDGVVTAVDCDLDTRSYALRPTFFGADAFENILNIRIQRGSDPQDRSDGVLFQIRDTSGVQADLLGVPIPIEDRPDALLQMGLYLNATCPTDFTGLDRPVVLAGDGGTVTFDAIYAPEGRGGGREVEATVSGATLRDPGDPTGRRAEFDGFFRFVFNRGRPAQRYP